MDAAQTISEIDGGRLQEDLNRELAKVQEAVANTGLKGSVTLKMNVRPGSIEMGYQQIYVDGAVKAAIPMPARNGINLYMKGGIASKRHPSQPQPKVPNDTSGLNMVDGQTQAAGDTL